MTTNSREIGTLIVVILKARNLPNKRHIGKQDPYCSIGLNGETRRTKAIKRGGQHPEWDEEVRFTLYEDDAALRSASGSGTPPPPPPKDGRVPRKIKGEEKMSLACYADDQKEPDLIGETVVDLTEVLTKGETDEWFTLTNKDKYCGEVYLELTFWSNEPRPERKTTAKVAKTNKQYGGPGSFVSTDESSPASSLRQGRTPSSVYPDEQRRESIPSSLLPSNSSQKLELYMPPYEQTARARPPRGSSGSSVDRTVNDFGELGLQDHAKRRESFPPLQDALSVQSTSSSRYSFASSVSSLHNYQTSELMPASDAGFRAVTTQGQRYHRNSVSTSQPYSMPQYQPSYQPPAPAPSGFSYHTPPRHHGPRYSVPAASSGFVPVPSASEPAGLSHQLPSHMSEPSGFAPPPSHTSIPSSGYAPAPSRTPVPLSHSPLLQHSPSVPPYLSSNPSVGSFYQPQPGAPQQPQVPFPQQAPYAPPPPVSAPSTQYLPLPPPSILPTTSQSAPPQAYPNHNPSTPTPHQEYVSPVSNLPQPSPTHTIPNYVPGSRPLPPQPQGYVQAPGAAQPPLPLHLQASGQPLPPPPVQNGYGQGSTLPPTSSFGPPPVQQHNPLPTPPGPLGHLHRGSLTPPQPGSSSVSPASSYPHIPPPPPLLIQASGSPQSYFNGSPGQTNGGAHSTLPTPPARTRAASGRPSLPLPPPPPGGPYQALPPPPPPPPPPPALPSSQSLQAYNPRPTSSFGPVQPFYPGPPPRPPAQITGPPNGSHWSPPEHATYYQGYEISAGHNESQA